jgi:signal transduction histidine kinase
MAKRETPVFRLTLIFISVVIASGSILTYFSINNISNLKELTEKKILEDQRELALIIPAEVQRYLDHFSARFAENIYDNQNDQATAIRFFDTINLVGNAFLLSQRGDFIWPWFTGNLEYSRNNAASACYFRYFNQAEKAEFIETDFNRASQLYLASLEASSSVSDSAASLNALARLSAKMDKGNEALRCYSVILSKYYSVSDSYGFPYAYYAITQVLQIAQHADIENVIHQINDILSRMATGYIPLNYSTGGILHQIEEWTAGQSIEIKLHDAFEEFIGIIRHRLEFIDKHADLIRETLHRTTDREELLFGGRFLTIAGRDHGELILVDPGTAYSAGFTIDLDQLWGKLIEQGFGEKTEFEYDMVLSPKINGFSLEPGGLKTVTDLSPYFPAHQVLIQLKNVKVVDEFVRRRSWIYGIAMILLIGGMILGVMLILRDISREEHLARLRSDFVSNVTHELKTPLTSVQLFTESIMMDRIKSEADRKEYLRIILKETGSLKRMINNILEFSRKERGKLEYKLQEVDLTSLVNTAVADLDYWISEKGFNLQTRIEDNITVMADPESFKQAIINLLSNAIKFSRNRKEIFVGLKKENGSVVLEVADKGIGIKEDQMDLIFEPFYRVGQQDAKDISGTGLGLTVVRDIIAAHNGKIHVESKLNEGSKFTIILNSNQEKSG